MNNGRNDRGPGAGHVCLLIHHYGPSGHTGGFRWHSLTSGLAARGWTFDVVTSTTLPAAQPPAGVRVHTVDEDWFGSRLRRRVAALPAASGRSVRSAGRRSPPQRADADAAPVTLPGPEDPWPGRRRALGEAPLAEQLRRDFTDASALLTEGVWARRVGRVAARLDRRPHIVISTSPAELLIPTGAWLARRLDAHHVTDFRDLWVIGRPEFAMRSRPLRFLGRHLEPWSLRHAATAVDIASPASVRRRHEGLVPCAFIPSGYPLSDDNPPAPDPEAFRVVYSGWWYDDMDPRPLLWACRALVDARPGSAEHLSLELVGTSTHVAGLPFHALAAAAGLSGKLEVTARLPRREAAGREQRAAVLVCYGFSDGMHTPSKLYGYARLRGRLLLIGTADDATAQEAALIGVPACTHADAATEVLIQAYDRWRAGGRWSINDRDEVLSDRRSVDRYDGLLLAVRRGDDMNRASAQYGPPLPPAAISLRAHPNLSQEAGSHGVGAHGFGEASR